jgi:hypothetical protein
LYLAPDNTLMAVQVEATDTWRSGRPQPLFRAPIAGDQTRYRSRYAVSADGQRFLFDSTDDPYAEQVTMIVNWSSLFER